MAGESGSDVESNRQRDFLTEPDGSFLCEKKMSNEKQIEQEIQDKGLNAPRLTPDHIDSIIAGETYTNLPDGRTVICQLTLKNGFTIDGKSACVSKENFNQEIGNKIARQNAREKIWELEGYLLKEKLHQAQ